MSFFFAFGRRYPAGSERKFYRLKVYGAINRGPVNVNEKLVLFNDEQFVRYIIL